jgi:hypothetical protein
MGEGGPTNVFDPAALIQCFSDKGYSPQKISPMIGRRISYRALYRWKNGEAKPQRVTDFLAVLDLAVALEIITSAERDASKFAFQATYIEPEAVPEGGDADEPTEDPQTDGTEEQQP